MTDKTLMHRLMRDVPPGIDAVPPEETLELVKSFARIQDIDRRRRIIDFARELLVEDTAARLN